MEQKARKMVVSRDAYREAFIGASRLYRLGEWPDMRDFLDALLLLKVKEEQAEMRAAYDFVYADIERRI